MKIHNAIHQITNLNACFVEPISFRKRIIQTYKEYNGLTYVQARLILKNIFIDSLN
jgi:hypothetical protein